MSRYPTRPPAESLAWVEASLGGSARVVQSKRLTGGLTSIVRALTVERNGRREHYVLRRLVPDEDSREWAGSAVEKESSILTKLEGNDIPAPRLIASTTDPAHGGLSVLMTKVAGRMNLMPQDHDRWLREMAQMLARIHSLEIAAPRSIRGSIWSACPLHLTRRARMCGMPRSLRSAKNANPHIAASFTATTSTSTCSGRVIDSPSRGLDRSVCRATGSRRWSLPPERDGAVLGRHRRPLSRPLRNRV